MSLQSSQSTRWFSAKQARCMAAAALALASTFTSVSQSAAAEVLLLKSGGRIEAEILNRNRATSDPYELRLTSGVTLTMAADQIDRVVVKTDVEKQYEMLLPRMPATAAGNWSMAEWCKEAGLLTQRKFHLGEIIKLEPDHEEARLALGYSKFGGEWMTTEDFMQGQGYVRSQGRWMLRQDVELAAVDRERELAEKDWRRQLKIWVDQLGRKRGEEALQSIREIRDVNAVPALCDVVADIKNPITLRMLCFEVLTKLPSGQANRIFMEIALNDPNANLRDKCLDELRRRGVVEAIGYFTKGLTSKDNLVVNRAAHCLGGLGNPEATLALIDALVTTHKFQITTGQAPGSLGASFGGDSSGGGGGGMGGLSMGGKPKIISQDLKNEMALSALAVLNPGINFGYDEAAWKRWYIQTHTTVNANLRRDD